MLLVKISVSGGVQRNLGIPELTEYEQTLLDTAIGDIQKEVGKAEKFLGVKESDRFSARGLTNKGDSCGNPCKERSLYD